MRHILAKIASRANCATDKNRSLLRAIQECHRRRVSPRSRLISDGGMIRFPGLSPRTLEPTPNTNADQYEKAQAKSLESAQKAGV